MVHAGGNVSLVLFELTAFQGEKESYASRGVCSFCKTHPAVKMNANPSRRKAYCASCVTRFGR